MKKCKTCGVEKSLDEFYKDSNAKDKKRNHCKICDKEKSKKYKEENELASKEYGKRYQKEKREILSAKKLENRKKNEEHYKNYSKQYYQKNKARIMLNNVRWYESKKNDVLVQARISEKGSKRRAAKLRATVSWSDRSKIKRIYLEAKLMTKQTGIVYHVDHIIPLQAKNVCGLHVEFNLQIVTMSENCSKRNTFVDDAP